MSEGLAWDSLDGLRAGTVFEPVSGRLGMGAWWKTVPDEHHAAMQQIVHQVSADYVNRLFTDVLFESFLHQLYGRITSYMYMLNR